MEDTQQQESISLEAFRQMKESGIDPYAMGETDAASQTQEGTYEADNQQIDTKDQQDHSEGTEEQIDVSTDFEDEEPIELPENQKTAFQKALEREKRKAREAAEATIKQEYESQLNPYKTFFDQLGMDPQKAIEALEQQKIQQEAQKLADYNGWTEEQTQMYMRQQELERKQTEMQVSLRVYELAETSDFPGIKDMKGAITEFIRSNPRVPVEQAYWAVGGANLAQQIKREEQQREIAKRTQTKRTVISDAPTDLKGPEPLTPEAVAFMNRTGLSEEQVRMMMKDQGPSNLDEYRKMVKKKG